MRTSRRSARFAQRIGVVIIAELTATGIGTGCAPSGLPRTNSDFVALGLPAAARDDDVLSAEEIAKSIGIDTAADAIARLRPQFLHRNGRLSPAGAPQPNVYLDTQYLGSADVLARIRIRDIREIRYLSLSDAQQRFGPSVSGPIIVVITR
jgi:hypothetical protein